MKKRVRQKMQGEGRIYAYRAYVDRLPHDQQEELVRQLKAANIYRNKLVEVELGRRQCVNETLSQLCPRLLEVEGKLLAAEVSHEALEAEVRQRNTQQQQRRVSKEDKARLKTSKQALKELRKERKELRRGLFQSPEWKERQVALNADQAAIKKQAYKAAECFWGTKLQVQEAARSFCEGAPPRFKRFDGTGKLAVQLQKHSVFDEDGNVVGTRGEMTVSKLLACDDGRLRLHRDPSHAWHGKKGWLASFRVGSEVRAPVFFELPIIFHRPLPEHAQIKWAWLLRKRVGTKFRWELQYVLEAQSFPRTRAAEGSVGMDVGWRVMPGGRLRIAVASGSDGREQELALPSWWIDAWRKTEHLDGIKKVLFNCIKGDLAKWLKVHTLEAPEELTSQLRTLHAWRSCRRLARFSLSLRRLAEEQGLWGFAEQEETRQAARSCKTGSELIDFWLASEADHSVTQALLLLESWRKRDRHLTEYQCQLRDQLKGARADLYWRWANRLSTSYRLAVIEDLDYRDFHRLPSVENDEDDNRDVKKMYARAAACSTLERFLRERMAEVKKVDPKHTTTTCHECGHNDVTWTDHAKLSHVCPECEASWDQDVNAARNLLAASGEPVPAFQPALAPEVLTYGPRKSVSPRVARKNPRRRKARVR